MAQVYNLSYEFDPQDQHVEEEKLIAARVL